LFKCVLFSDFNASLDNFIEIPILYFQCGWVLLLNETCPLLSSVGKS